MDKYIFCLFVFFFVLFAVHEHEEQQKTDYVAKLDHLLNSKTSVTYRLTQDGKSCTKPGLMCEDCAKVSYCIQMPGGNWLKEDMEDCPSGSTCLESSGTCTTESNPSCEGSVPGYEFTCHQPGVFPDPFNCQRYHMCIPGNQSEVVKTSIKMKCDNSFYYDPKNVLFASEIKGCILQAEMPFSI